MSWRELGRHVEAIEHEVMARVGHEPLVVGFDKYHLASELAFYDPEGDGAHETVARTMFGRPSLMYDWWFTAAQHRGKSAVLVSDERHDLGSVDVAARFERLEPVRDLIVERNGAVVGHYFTRIAHGYRPSN